MKPRFTRFRSAFRPLFRRQSARVFAIFFLSPLFSLRRFLICRVSAVAAAALRVYAFALFAASRVFHAAFRFRFRHAISPAHFVPLHAIFAPQRPPFSQSYYILEQLSFPPHDSLLQPMRPPFSAFLPPPPKLIRHRRKPSFEIAFFAFIVPPRRLMLMLFQLFAD
jgi:hypothetical protein